MSFLTLEFAILFLKLLNIDFPLILISLNVVEEAGERRLMYLQMQQLGEYQARKHNLNHLIHYAVHSEVKTSQQSVIG